MIVIANPRRRRSYAVALSDEWHVHCEEENLVVDERWRLSHRETVRPDSFPPLQGTAARERRASTVMSERGSSFGAPLLRNADECE